jgi:hypothetical protein
VSVAKKRNSRKPGSDKRRTDKKTSRAHRHRDEKNRRKTVNDRRQSREWKAFERLVARIEETLSPHATVKSPDHIPDLTTKTLREVDASVRFMSGSVPVLFTIECRRRKRKDDVLWIEQLATKRTSIGANQTIAVSSGGFSKEATEKARLLNLELRRLHDVTDDEIATWSKDLQLVVVEGNFCCEATGFRLADLSDSEKAKVKRLGERIADGDDNTIAMYRCSDGEPISKGAVQQMVMEASRRNPAIIAATPGARATIGISYALADKFYIPFGNKKVPIHAIQLEGTILDSTRTSFPVSRVMEYASAQNPLVHVAQFDVPVGPDSPAGFVEIHRQMRSSR